MTTVLPMFARTQKPVCREPIFAASLFLPRARFRFLSNFSGEFNDVAQRKNANNFQQ